MAVDKDLLPEKSYKERFEELLSGYYNNLKALPVGDAVGMFLKHKMYVEARKKQLEEELIQSEAVMEAAKNAVRDNLQASGSKSMSFEGLGSVSLVSSSKFSIGQADVLQAYIAQHPDQNPIDIFGATLKKAGVEEFLERTGLTAESLGIKPYTEITVRFNAPRGAKSSE